MLEQPDILSTSERGNVRRTRPALFSILYLAVISYFNLTPADVLLRFNISHHRRHPYEVGRRSHSSANNIFALHVRLQHQHQCSNLTRHGMDTTRKRFFFLCFVFLSP